MGDSERSDRRRAVRIPERIRISFRTIHEGGADPKTNAAETQNISASGLCMVTPAPLEPDAQLALELDVGQGGKPLVAVGRVVWCDRDGENHRVGVCFTWLRDEDRQSLAEIAAYVESRLEE